MIHEHRLDWLTWLCAGFSFSMFALSFWQAVALGIAIISGLLSVTLGSIRLHDRIRYGPAGVRK